ncbi:MAG: PBP1A family penicillin-binding protein [bacterium]|nr:PBP1A family penicillin-binding protein [bacterium]
MAIYHLPERITNQKSRLLSFFSLLKAHPWKTTLKATAVLLVSLFAIGVFTFALIAAWVSRDLPDPNALTTRDVAQSTKIFDRTGTHLLYELHGDENRTLVKIEEIPDIIKKATIAVEDKNFYQHHGIYWKGLVRAVLANITNGVGSQGASTLTQQLVKNALLTNEKTITRKFKEFLLALQIERTYNKDQILQMYLNEIPYGPTEYGVESASQSYFGKNIKDVTLDEAALLASIPQSTDFYNPYGTGVHGDNRVKLVARQHRVLDLMVDQGYLTKEAAEEAKKIDTLKKLKPKTIGKIQAPHFVMYVRSQLTEKYGQKATEQGGLKVTTTLDWDKQQAAEEEVKKGVDARGATYKFTNAALISLDPTNGQIVAMVGSKDFFNTEDDGQVNVTLRPRQPGSSFKPIVYAVGFMKGLLPQTTLWDVNTTFKTDTKDYTPHNYDLKERGPISIRQALQGSLNIPAVQMLYLSGIGRVLDFAESLGYSTFGDRSRFGLALVLGGGEVTPLEHARAYAAFANEGINYPTSSILKVESATGEVLEEWKQPDGTRVMDPQIARLVSNVLSDNAARAYVFGASNSLTLPDRQVATKTGTTNDYHDAWTAGYTPNLATVVWVGNNNNDAMKRGADGSIVAAPIWQAYMKRATKSMSIVGFTPPEPPSTNKAALLGQAAEQKIKIDIISGKRATEYTPAQNIIEQTYHEAHTILYYVDKDDPTGPAPTNPASDPQFANWEAAVQDWARRANWNVGPPPPTDYDDVHTLGTQPTLSIVQPTDNQTLNSRDFTIQVNVTGQRLIVRMEASIDGVALGVMSNTSILNAHIPDLIDRGTHRLTIRAVDDLGNVGTTSITILLTAERTAGPQITIDAPAADTAWSQTSFPHSVDVHVVDPTLYPRIDAIFIGDDGVQRMGGSEMNPSSNPIRINISLGPTAGRYRLVVSATTMDGLRIDKAEQFITITQ